MGLPTQSHQPRHLSAKRPDRTRSQQETQAYAEAALANAKREGLLLAVRARWVALAVIGVISPILFPHWEVLYYEAILLLFALIGWAQLQVGEVGRSRRELLLIFCDLALMTFIIVGAESVAGSRLAGGDAVPSRQLHLLLRAAGGRDAGLFLAHDVGFRRLDHRRSTASASSGPGFSRSIAAMTERIERCDRWRHAAFDHHRSELAQPADARLRSWSS